MTDTTTKDGAAIEAQKRAAGKERMEKESHHETVGKEATEEKKADK